MLEYLLAPPGVHYLGMELNPEDAPLPILHCRYRRIRCFGDNREADRSSGDGIAVTHPHHLLIREFVE